MIAGHPDAVAAVADLAAVVRAEVADPTDDFEPAGAVVLGHHGLERLHAWDGDRVLRRLGLRRWGICRECVVERRRGGRLCRRRAGVHRRSSSVLRRAGSQAEESQRGDRWSERGAHDLDCAPPVEWEDAVARPAGFEPATDRLEVCCSIQLSYERSTGCPDVINQSTDGRPLRTLAYRPAEGRGRPRLLARLTWPHLSLTRP